MVRTKEEIIEMSRYVNAEPIHDKCKGCERIFDWHGDEGTIVIQKCRIYSKPAIFWEQKPVALESVLVRSKDHPKGIWEDLPVREFFCPQATHYKGAAHEAAEKKRVGQQKTKRRNRI